MSERENDYTEQSDRPYLYEIVPEGINYGIALRGRTILHDMELGRARETLEILNSALDRQLHKDRFRV